MNKKGVAIQWTWLAIILLAMLLFNSFGIRDRLGIDFNGLSTGQIFSSERTSETSSTNTITEYHTTDTQYVRTNLCNLFQPYIVASDIINYCFINGGQWRCEANFVGCSNAVTPMGDCTSPVTQTALYQCQSVNAQYVCNPTNAYCYYP